MVIGLKVVDGVLPVCRQDITRRALEALIDLFRHDSMVSARASRMVRVKDGLCDSIHLPMYLHIALEPARILVQRAGPSKTTN